MYSMEIVLTDGRKAITFTTNKWEACNWFMNTACRPGVVICKVAKISKEGKTYTILRYRDQEEE